MCVLCQVLRWKAAGTRFLSSPAATAAAAAVVLVVVAPLLLVRKKSDSYRTTYFARVVAIGCENSTRELG